MSSAASVCLRCQFRSFLTAFGSLSRSCQPQRTYATAMRQKRKKPARMTLSQNVARSAERVRPPRPHDNRPFAGMNQRVSRIPAPVPRRPTSSQSDQLPEKEKRVDKEKRISKDGEVFHALKMQQTLAPLSYTQRNALKERLERITTFEEFSLLPLVNEAIYSQALPGMTNIEPTDAQKVTIPALMSNVDQNAQRKRDEEKLRFNSFLLAAETGSGKTLAYLLPIIDAIKRNEDVEQAKETMASVKAEKERAEKEARDVFEVEAPKKEESLMARPKAIILTPTSELVTQVGRLLKALSHTAKLSTAAISAAHTPTRIYNALFRPSGLDIIVSTPHLISSIAEKDPNILSRVKHLVVDEADSLLDKSFSSTTGSIIDRSAPSLKQLILCSATIPNSLDRYCDRHYPQIKRLVTPKLHAVPRRVTLGVVDIDKAPYNGNRQLACADIIWQIGKNPHEDNTITHYVMRSIIVFVNERETAEELAKVLASKGIDAAPLTRDTSEARQAEILSTFTSRNLVAGEAKPPKQDFRDFVPFEESSKPKRYLPNTKVIVTTDLGSRGIDTLSVREVVLYDVPHTTIDFVHRLGRLGRMGRRGKGIVLVGKNDRRDIVSEVKHAMFKGQALI